MVALGKMNKVDRRTITVGQKIGGFTILGTSHTTPGHKYFHVECSCGVKAVWRTDHLREKESVFCSHKRRRLHGGTGTPEYKAWLSMISRCFNTANGDYQHYGGRGITVCEKWKASFLTFLSDMGNRPSDKHSLDRIDNDGNYEPSNCRWATKQEQASNRRTNLKHTCFGKTMCQEEWARSLGLKGNAIQWRLQNGWSLEDALSIPSGLGKRKRIKE